MRTLSSRDDVNVTYIRRKTLIKFQRVKLTFMLKLMKFTFIDRKLNNLPYIKIKMRLYLNSLS